MDELGLGPTLQSRVSDDYVRGVVSCFPPLSLQHAHNPPREQLSFSVFAVVIDKAAETLVTISDLISTGSTERKLLLQGDAKSRTLETGDLVLLLNPMGDRVRLTVNSGKNIIVIGKLPDIGSCSSANCQKPVVSSRDGNVCWQHAINATSANIRSDTSGGILVSTKKPQITKIYSASMSGTTTSKPDPKKAKHDALDAKKKNLLWFQERTADPRIARDRMMRAAKANTEPEPVFNTVLVKNGEDDLEIEFEEDPRKTAPAMCEMILPALPPAEENEPEPQVEEPPQKKQKKNDESFKLALPTFSSDSEEDNPLLAFNQEELDQIRANYR